MPQFSVTRSIRINAPAEPAFAPIRDLQQWRRWSPWLLAEPDCQTTVSEEGRRFSWEGAIVGAGEVELQEERPRAELLFRLRFLKPWKSVATAAFRLEPRDGAVELTWTMESALPFFLFWMKGMMTAMIGMDFYRGLLRIKDCVELGEPLSQLEFVGKSPSAGFRYVGVQKRCSPLEVGEEMPTDFRRLLDWLDEKELSPAGSRTAIYSIFNPARERVVYIAAVPFDAALYSLPDGFVSGEVPPHQCYVIRHRGPYRHLGDAWAAGMMRERARVFRANRKIHPYEIYENDFDQTPEKDLLTSVRIPIA